MKIYRYAAWVFVILAALVGVGRTSAQPEGGPPPGGGPPVNLANLALQKSVQEELKLSTDEIDRLRPLAGNGRESPRGEGRDREAARERHKQMLEKAAEDDKKIAEILQPDQFQRLKQIGFQVAGPRAFKNPAVVSALALTEAESESIDSVLRDSQGDMRKLFQDGGLKQGDSDEVKAFNRQQIAKVRDSAVEKVVALLTSDQQAKWKELIGEPFKGEIDWSQFGPRRGGRPRSRD